jgi:RimJ/RimL family protein N-acetyltransferase/nitroimidazol reductase NimA-like FMN-containing flavoprotein (pyridoxamine 5'-phosphate oxidase superfamily)
MRKVNQEITETSTIREILKSSKICRIGMIDNGLPYVLPFNYGYDDNQIYIHCAQKGKKLDLIKENPIVCFEIEQIADIVKNEKACKWVTTYRSIVGYGKIEMLTDFALKKKGLEIIMAHNGASDLIDFEPKHVDSVLILKLKIDSLTAKQSNNWDNIYNSSMYNLTSKRLYLNEINWNDLDTLHQLHSIPEIDEFNTRGIPETTSETREVIKNAIDDKQNQIRKIIAWTIWTKDTNDFIGEAGINLSANRFKLGEIYYNLHPKYWNRGFGTETVKRLIDFGFNDLGLHKVEAGVATDNIRSIRVLEKAGMIREGLRRRILPIRGEWKDNYHYAIVEDDKRSY